MTLNGALVKCITSYEEEPIPSLGRKKCWRLLVGAWHEQEGGGYETEGDPTERRLYSLL